MMKFVLLAAFFSITLSACTDATKRYDTYESDNLKIEQISEKVFQHTSYLATRTMGDVPCNGMVYLNGNEAIIFDTPVDERASAELINWVGKEKVKAVVATHFHVDCLGGLNQFHAAGIPSYATEETIRLARENTAAGLPQHGFRKQRKFTVGDQPVYARYYGPGHTDDNIVGYVPSENALFGGCLVKQVDASKGNLADADTTAWPRTIAKLKDDLAGLRYVIPGHGKSGGTELLDYTAELFSAGEERYLFFLHNRFLETHGLHEVHPEFGRTEYAEILSAFAQRGLTVISEKRNGNVNAHTYALRVHHQIDSLIAAGIPPENITVAGTSKGGYIAQYVSTLANNPKLNFVFIGSFQKSDLQRIPDVNFCGNILTIFEASDPFGVSAAARQAQSSCVSEHFTEIALQTGLGHGFLFKPLAEWIEPTAQWAKGNYALK